MQKSKKEREKNERKKMLHSDLHRNPPTALESSISDKGILRLAFTILIFGYVLAIV